LCIGLCVQKDTLTDTQFFEENFPQTEKNNRYTAI
jgi:hypothetical protein